jgi:hypothetical protein
MIDLIWHRLASFAAQPYKGEEGDLVDWALLIGATLAFAYLWSRVIARLAD